MGENYQYVLLVEIGHTWTLPSRLPCGFLD